MEFLSFLKTKNSNSYLMDLGRFSDSSKSFMMEVPLINTDNVFTIENGKIVFS